MNYYDEIEKQNIIKIREHIASLPSFCKDFFRSIEPRTTTKTQLAYTYDLSVFFLFLVKYNPSLKYEKISLDDINNLTFKDIEEYMEYLKYYHNNDNEKLNQEVSIKRKIASLRSFYNYYYNNDLIENNPVAKIKLPKIRDKQIIRLEVDEIAKLLDSVETGENLTKKEKIYHGKTKLRDITILYLLLGTGIRISECVGINLNDIDIKNTSIKIKRKGGKEAIIYYSDEVANKLEQYINYRKTIFKTNDKDNNALFLSLQNKRISQRAIQKLVKKYATHITPLKNITPHKLRSTYGTNLYKETNDIYLVAGVLGHNDVNTTRKHYAALEEDQKKLARNKIKLRDDIEN